MIHVVVDDVPIRYYDQGNLDIMNNVDLNFDAYLRRLEEAWKALRIPQYILQDQISHPNDAYLCFQKATGFIVGDMRKRAPDEPEQCPERVRKIYTR